MSKIQLLDQDLINKIAAGEVVERPASVVKELMENSLDAGANNITLEVEQGGIDLIKIIDDGCGMSAEDAKMSVRRHATSKISTVDDLHNISTLGFRGEALAAISAVSQFRLITRQQGEVGATEVACKDGETHCKSAAGAEGTTIEIRGLFYSVPARKKFLKAANTEYRYLLEVFTHQALLKPQVSWKLIHNGKEISHYPKVNDWKDRVEAILGKELAQNLIDINYQRGSMIIKGFLAHPAFAKDRSKQQYLFVNQRPVNDYLLSKAVRDGYSHHIPKGTYPSFVIQISIAPDLVDVNVHPRKTEVKFADSSSVFREVVRSVREALGNIATNPYQASEKLFDESLPDFNKPTSSSKPTINYQLRPSSTQIKQSFNFQSNIARPQRSTSITQSKNHHSNNNPENHAANPYPPKPEAKEGGSSLNWKLLGQVHSSFIIAETEECLMIIDQHAVAEKVLYEKMLANLEAPKVQALLVPLMIDLSAQQLALISEHQETLQSCGVEGEEFGGNSYRLTGIPQDLDTSDIKVFFFELLEDISAEEFGKINSLDGRQKKLLKYAACRGAIKFNDPLTEEEQLQLLSDVKEHNIVACIHGRPAIMKMTWEQLAKQFHRP